MGKARGVQQCCRLAQDTAHGQNAAGEHAVHAAGQHHRADGAPLAGAQTEGALAVGLGHGLQALLRSTHDGGQVHDDQGHGAGEKGFLHAQELAEEHLAHQAVDNGGDAGQRLGGVLDNGHYPLVGGILRQVHGGADAQGQHHQQRGQHRADGGDDIRQDADGAVQIAGLGAQQLPTQVGHALDEHIDDEKHRQRAGNGGAEEHQAPHGPTPDTAAGRELMFVHGHFSLLRLRKKLSAALMSMMNRNSTSAMENSA